MKFRAILVVALFLTVSPVGAMEVPQRLYEQTVMLAIITNTTSDTGQVSVRDKEIFQALAPERLKRDVLNDPANARDLVFRLAGADRELFASLRLTIENGAATVTPEYEEAMLASNAASHDLMWYITGERGGSDPFSKEKVEQLVQAAASATAVDFFSQGQVVPTLAAIAKAEEVHEGWVKRLTFLLTP